MSSDNESEESEESEKNYTCHPAQRVKLKVCIICENVYHSSDFNRLKDTIKISEILVICPDHAGLDLTSRLDVNTLTNEAKTIIAQVKLREKEKAQKEILDNISQNLSTHCDEKLNLTISGTQEDNDTVLKAEILLLRQLNNEMQDKNNILKELVTRVKNEHNEHKKDNSKSTYANVLKSDNTQVKHVPPLIIKSKQDKNKKLTHKTVVNKITNEIIVPVDSIIETKTGNVIIKCNDTKDIMKIEDQLNDKIGTDFEIYREELKEARLKIIGIKNKFELEELENDNSKQKL